MLKAIVIEDEKPAMEALVQNLSRLIPAVEVKARLTSVKESISFLKEYDNADIIFSDVQLSDGLSFDIFTATGIQIPVIFITGYDEFIMKAFECNSIDYLLKPIGKDDLDKALTKYYTLQKHFANKPPDIQKLNGYLNQNEKKRILVKKGSENINIKK
jgi:two-component SAPR family response regulator